MIDRRWLPLNALRAFEAAGRHLGFAAAANTLSVSQSAISRHVISLKGLLGVQLFERPPHQLALTDTGAASLNLERFHQGCNRSSTRRRKKRPHFDGAHAASGLPVLVHLNGLASVLLK